jgi:hypothetical protein
MQRGNKDQETDLERGIIVVYTRSEWCVVIADDGGLCYACMFSGEQQLDCRRGSKKALRLQLGLGSPMFVAMNAWIIHP